MKTKFSFSLSDTDSPWQPLIEFFNFNLDKNKKKTIFVSLWDPECRGYSRGRGSGKSIFALVLPLQYWHLLYCLLKIPLPLPLLQQRRRRQRGRQQQGQNQKQ